MRSETYRNRKPPRELLTEKDVDAVGCPGSNAAAEEVSVLSPDRTTESQCRCQNRPVFRIARAETLPSLGFEVGILVSVHDGREPSHPLQSCQRQFGIATALYDECGQVLLRLRQCAVGNEERNALRMGFKDASNPLTEHSPNQDVGVKHQGFALHAGYLELRFLSRPARRTSLYSRMSSSSDAPQAAIMVSSSRAAARIASISALRLRFCAGM